MELAPKRFGYRSSPGTNSLHALKSSRYFLLEHSRKVFVRPQFTCHVPLSSGRQPPQNGFQGDYLSTGD